MGSRSPFALFSPLLYKATREANPLPALAPATSLPRGPGSLWWKGGQWIRRPAVYSCSLGLGFVARSSGVRRHAPARLTAPSNKVPSRSASNAASLAVVGHGSGSVVAGFGRQDDGGDQTLVFCASVLSSSRRRSLRLRPQISKLVQERGGRHGLHQCRRSGDLLLRCKSEVFAVAFAVLAAGAIILTLNVLLLGGQIIFFQSLSLLGYCLFPLDVGALICLLNDNDILKIVVVAVTLAWSSWAAYPFMSAAVNPRRKALALYPVFLLYVSVGFLIIAIN